MFKELISILSGSEPAPPDDSFVASQIAIAAILVEAARADGVYLDSERQTIDAILADRFELNEADAAELRKKGEVAQAEAVDLVRFTRVVKESVPHEDRLEVIEAVWRIIYADNDRESHESALVRRLCDLLYISDRDAGLVRQKVAD